MSVITKEHRPFEESPDIPKEFSTVQRGYFGSIRNYSNQVVGLIKRGVRMQKRALYNLRRAIAELSSMQDFFGNMSLDQVYWYKHKVLCEQEDQKLIETYMCCEYYTQHQANADFNKYQVKKWYTFVRGKEIDEVNTAFEMLQKEYHAEFPIQNEDSEYLTYMLVKVKEKISSMLNEVKMHLPSEVYSDLSTLCDMTYKGEVFDKYEVEHALVLKYQYM